VIDNYKENRLIFEELNHYKTHHSILGKHPVFDWFKRAQQIRSMRTGDLIKTRINAVNGLNKLRKRIANEPHHGNTSARLNTIATLEKVLKLTNQILGL
jgi:hypothetical protein